MKVYMCDYKKNDSCKKSGCFYSTLDATTGCVCTINQEYAVKLKDGTPIIANDDYERLVKCEYIRRMQAQIDRAFIQMLGGYGE